MQFQIYYSTVSQIQFRDSFDSDKQSKWLEIVGEI